MGWLSAVDCWALRSSGVVEAILLQVILTIIIKTYFDIAST